MKEIKEDAFLLRLCPILYESIQHLINILFGTASSKITLVILFQIFQDKQQKNENDACIEMYG